MGPSDHFVYVTRYHYFEPVSLAKSINHKLYGPNVVGETSHQDDDSPLFVPRGCYQRQPGQPPRSKVCAGRRARVLVMEPGVVIQRRSLF